MHIVAGRHFNRGQRAFFFALAYLGWFIGPLMLIGTTVVVVVAILIRQFASDALKAVSLELPLAELGLADLEPEHQAAGSTSEMRPDRR